MKFKKRCLCSNCGKKFVDSRGLITHKKICSRKKTIQKRRAYLMRQKRNHNRYATKKEFKKKKLTYQTMAQISYEEIKSIRLKLGQNEIKGLKVIDFLGQGRDGAVYECLFKNKICAVKKAINENQYKFWNQHLDLLDEQKVQKPFKMIAKPRQKTWYLFFQKADTNLKQFLSQNFGRCLHEKVFDLALNCINELINKNIYHGDLRLRNILVWKQNLRLKITDFAAAEYGNIFIKKKYHKTFIERTFVDLYKFAEDFYDVFSPTLNSKHSSFSRIKRKRLTKLIGKETTNRLLNILVSTKISDVAETRLEGDGKQVKIQYDLK